MEIDKHEVDEQPVEATSELNEGLGVVERRVRRDRPRWGKHVLIAELDCLASRMRKIAERMQEHEGEIKEHGEELERAAKTAKTWAKGIEEQLGNQQL